METFKARIVVAPDSSGYHLVADYNNHKAVIDILQHSMNGDYWANRENDVEFPDDTDWESLSEMEWESFTSEFFRINSRGDISMNEVDVILPSNQNPDSNYSSQ